MTDRNAMSNPEDDVYIPMKLDGTQMTPDEVAAMIEAKKRACILLVNEQLDYAIAATTRRAHDIITDAIVKHHHNNQANGRDYDSWLDNTPTLTVLPDFRIWLPSQATGMGIGMLPSSGDTSDDTARRPDRSQYRAIAVRQGRYVVVDLHSAFLQSERLVGELLGKFLRLNLALST